jgi:hypothetical protein
VSSFVLPAEPLNIQDISSHLLNRNFLLNRLTRADQHKQIVNLHRRAGLQKAPHQSGASAKLVRPFADLSLNPKAPAGIEENRREWRKFFPRAARVCLPAAAILCKSRYFCGIPRLRAHPEIEVNRGKKPPK